MLEAPVLLIGFNRPDRLARLIESLRVHRPATVRVAIDGPRALVPGDETAVKATIDAVNNLDWTEDLVVHHHDENLGIRKAIPWAVTWILNEFPEAIIIEDDVTVGPQFLEFANHALRRWSDDETVFAVSGYNIVPGSYLDSQFSMARYSQLVHSYAWATWRRAWLHYDSEMQWFARQSLGALSRKLGSRLAALRWRQFAAHVRSNRVQTWDYQWAMSIWSKDGRTVMPNRNLIDYHGFTGGTHTTRRRSWGELPIEHIEVGRLDELSPVTSVDHVADSYVQQFGHRATPIGVTLGYLEGPAMSAAKRFKI